MKNFRLIFIIALLCFTGKIWAQNSNVPTRNFLIEVTNKRGKPVSDVVVHSLYSGEVGMTDKAGKYSFKDVTNDEIVRIFIPKQEAKEFPVAGLDSLRIIIRPNEISYYDLATDKEINIGYGTTNRSSNTMSVSTLDAENVVRQSSANNLFDLIKGRVSGVVISGNSVKIRGVSSINSGTEPLVVVDGVAIGTLAQADQMLNVNDVKDISVLKDGSAYGIRGANGVILITTKTGGK